MGPSGLNGQGLKVYAFCGSDGEGWGGLGGGGCYLSQVMVLKERFFSEMEVIRFVERRAR